MSVAIQQHNGHTETGDLRAHRTRALVGEAHDDPVDPPAGEVLKDAHFMIGVVIGAADEQRPAGGGQLFVDALGDCREHLVAQPRHQQAYRPRPRAPQRARHFVRLVAELHHRGPYGPACRWLYVGVVVDHARHGRLRHMGSSRDIVERGTRIYAHNTPVRERSTLKVISTITCMIPIGSTTPADPGPGGPSTQICRGHPAALRTNLVGCHPLDHLPIEVEAEPWRRRDRGESIAGHQRLVDEAITQIDVGGGLDVLDRHDG